MVPASLSNIQLQEAGGAAGPGGVLRGESRTLQAASAAALTPPPTPLPLLHTLLLLLGPADSALSALAAAWRPASGEPCSRPTSGGDTRSHGMCTRTCGQGARRQQACTAFIMFGL
jgi:hypothetical protein